MAVKQLHPPPQFVLCAEQAVICTPVRKLPLPLRSPLLPVPAELSRAKSSTCRLNELTESDVGGAESEPELENVSVEPADQGKDEYVYGYFYPAEDGGGQ